MSSLLHRAQFHTVIAASGIHYRMKESEAIRSYEAGATILLGIDETFSTWRKRIADALGKPDPSGDSFLYAVKRGGGLGVHFDPSDNFTIQISGEKTWEVSNSSPVEHPLHDVGRSGDAVLYSPEKEIPPRRMRRVNLTPGSMLYVPRGFWHATKATQDSLSLDIKLEATPWFEFVVSVLRKRLLRNPEWRRTARIGGSGDYLRSPKLRQFLRLLGQEVNELADQLAHPAAGVIRPLHPQTLLRRNSLGYWHVIRKANQRLWVEIRSEYNEGAFFELPLECLEGLRWCSQQTRPFSFETLARKLSGLSKASTKRFVVACLSSGLLRTAIETEDARHARREDTE